MSPADRALRIAILAFDDVEALDLTGPYEVFTTARRMQQGTARQMNFAWTRPD